ncbi:hypothetical protein NFI96_003462 [Prochilodus magdalenae]|nr:hypothetical protein NFI96_003462 [Prochilodus magdalenae]
MEHKILLIMVLTGICSSASATNKYHFVHKAKSFADAQLYCRNTYSDLATINDMEDMNTLLETVTDGYTDLAWIGLYQQSAAEWHWSLSTLGFYAEGERAYRNWRTGMPDNAGDCGSMAENGQFWDFSCSYRKRFICYDDKMDQKYILINDYKTWRDAQSYCRLNHIDLTSVRNLDENLKVQQVIGSGQSPYIGLFRDKFTWSDSSSSSFRYWASDQPQYSNVSECCVGLDVLRREWACVECTSTIPFFCYTGQFLSVYLKADEPYLSPLIQKIKQDMKDRGMPEQTKITWKQQPDGSIFHKKQPAQEHTNTCG